MNLLNLGLLIFAYILGSINSAIIICYLFRLPSPRTIGSGNPGTTNVLRIGGKFPAILTLLFDLLKGVIPVVIAKLFCSNEIIVPCVALWAIIGHIFPIFFGFKGGKGVATFIGTLIAFNWILSVIFVITWLLTAKITKYSSLSALVATIVASTSIIPLTDLSHSIPFLIIAIIIIIKHKSNIKKLINRTESKIGDKAKK